MFSLLLSNTSLALPGTGTVALPIAVKKLSSSIKKINGIESNDSTQWNAALFPAAFLYSIF